jgi:hypothetical protein
MKPKTNQERQKSYRERAKNKGLSEVRGIYAKSEHHKKIKVYANKIEKRGDL